MHWMRIAAAALLLPCLLAACQSAEKQPQTAESPVASGAWLDGATYDNYQVTGPMKGPFIDTMTELTRKLLTRCLDASGPGEGDACIRERLLAGYDTSGAAEFHCPPGGNLEQQFLCIAIGSYVQKFVQALDLESPPRMNWNNPESTMQLAAMAFMQKSMGKCLGGFSASDPTQCLLGAMADRLGLLESDIEPCRVLTDDMEFGQCIGEAYTLIFVREGLARM